jgi:anti-anti-sigma factor
VGHAPPKVTTHSVADVPVWVVELRGDQDFTAVSELHAVLAPLLEGGDPIVVDLTGVTLIESRILGTLIATAKRIEPHGFAVVAPRGSPAASLFGTAGARAFFAILPTVNAALSWCRARA